MRAYNLFRSKGRSALYCAVPEEYTIPAFLTAAAWEFSVRIDERAARPFAFDAKAARTGARYNGFHLFLCFETAEEPAFH